MNHSLIHLVLFVGTIVPLSAQGPLAPPGAPAPTMKSLAQIEPRTDVLTLGAEPPYTITEPGSYYLSANIIAASGRSSISIQAENVTLDLNGFTISSPFGVLPATDISLSYSAVIRNGYIKSGDLATDGSYAVNGFLNGIFSFGA